MKTQPSIFADTSIQLSFKDLFLLFIGKSIKPQYGCYVIGLWQLPDNGCPCEECRKVFKK